MNLSNCLFLILLCLAIGGSFLVLLTTQHGVGMSADSVTYIMAARNLAIGKGISALHLNGKVEPLVIFPPLYPIILGGINLIGIDPVIGVRWLNAFLFAGSIFLTGIILKNITNKNWPVIVGTLFFISYKNTLLLFSMALSEPVFIFLIELSFLFILLYISGPRISILLFWSIITGLTILTRYAGMFLILLGILVICRLCNTRQKFYHSVLYLLLALSPPTLWILSHRSYYVHPENIRKGIYPCWGKIKYGLEVIRSWVWPFSFPIYLKAIFGGVIVLGLIILYINLSLKGISIRIFFKKERVWPVLLAAVLLYAGEVLIVVRYFGADTWLEPRILFPLFIFSLIFIMFILSKVPLYHLCKASTFLFIIAGVILFGFYCSRSYSWVLKASRQGWGYSNKVWRNSQTIQAVKKLPPGVIIYSNAPDAIYILTGRVAYYIPCYAYPVNNRPNDRFLDQMVEVRNIKGEKYLVYFYNKRRWYLPNFQEIINYWKLKKCKFFTDGLICKIF